MKKIFSILVLFLLIFPIAFSFSGCSVKETVVIYTNSEDFRIEKFEECMQEEFPDLDVVVEYYSTGELAAKILSEGFDTRADIIWGIDEANTNRLSEFYADLSDYDTSKYLDEYVDPNHKYHVWSKEAGCVIINKAVFAENGWDIPDTLSFEDLLDAKFANQIVMPNPKTSGTGYFYYNTYVANYGKEAAINYFTQLNGLVKEFSTSGSGPVKMADRGEIAIGLGMTFQAVDYVNNNDDLMIMFLEEGSPYSLYTAGIAEGKQTKESVKRVYDYMYDTFFALDKELFNPEIIYKNQTISKPGYPTEITYAQMTRMGDAAYKQELLDAWPF